MRKLFEDSLLKDYYGDILFLEDDLIVAKDKALLVDRKEVLRNANLDVPKKSDDDSLTFVINHDSIGSTQIRNLIYHCTD